MTKLTKAEIKVKQKRFNALVRETARGNFECWVDVPNFRKVRAEITEIRFGNIFWKPFHVHFLEDISQTRDELTYDCECWCPDECNGHYQEVTSRYSEDGFTAEKITIIKKEK
jgi:hypothetical protein